MSIALLFLIAGFIVMYLIYKYEKQNNKKVEDILRANKNVPPLFMLRSAELKVNAIKSALKGNALAADQDELKEVSDQLDDLVNGYKERQINLATYYSKLGALLIQVSALKGVQVEVEIS